jgi:C-terminal processing protease CtpA/Prc
MLLKKVVTFGVMFISSTAWSQMSKFDRDRAEEMLHVVGDDVRKHYYDPKFHGLDWDAKMVEAKQKIHGEKSFNMAMSHIAAMLDTLNDSHTFFLPPQHAYRHDFGWQYQMFGERCFITQVRPKSDAEVKGVKAGDEILTINGFTPARDNLWKMQYVFSVLRPQPKLHLSLQDVAGNRREVEVAAKIKELKRVTDVTGAGGASDIWDLIRQGEVADHLARVRTADYDDKLMILKLPGFWFSPTEVGDMIGKAET